MEMGVMNNSPLFGAVIHSHSLTHINVRSFIFFEKDGDYHRQDTEPS